MHAVTQSLGYDSQLVEERREYAVASVVYKIELVAAFSGDVKHAHNGSCIHPDAAVEVFDSKSVIQVRKVRNQLQNFGLSGDIDLCSYVAHKSSCCTMCRSSFFIIIVSAFLNCSLIRKPGFPASDCRRTGSGNARPHGSCIEVEKEIYEVMNRFELDDLSYLNEMDNHYERSELTEAALTKRAQKKAESVDALVLEKLQNENLKETVLRLPEIQRRRVVLYYYGGFTCKQIAEQENCSVIAVKKTLDAARKNLKKLLE